MNAMIGNTREYERDGFWGGWTGVRLFLQTFVFTRNEKTKCKESLNGKLYQQRDRMKIKWILLNKVN